MRSERGPLLVALVGALVAAVAVVAVLVAAVAVG
jgi:hypothetical protein